MPAERDSAIERRAPITVVRVDDERLIRAALAQTLAGAGLELVGEAASMKDAIEVVVDLRPDVVLMDIKLPEVRALAYPVPLMTVSPQHDGAVPPISAEEFRTRRAAVAKEAADRGLSALVLFSRGGTTVDFYGDVMYLANFHSAFPVVPDAAVWAARGHCAMVVPVGGSSVLITDYFDDHEDRVQVEDVRVSLSLPRALGEVLRELGLEGERLGLVGGETMTLRWFRQVEEGAGRALEVTPADDILERQRLIKSEAELGLMRQAAAVGVGWMDTTMNAIAEGRTDGEVVGEGLRYLAAHGGTHADVAIASGPKSRHYFGSCGVPHWDHIRPLQNGDIVHIDQWGPVENYFTDFGRSTVVGRTPSGEQRELLEASVAVVEHVVAAVRPGITFAELYERGASWLVEHDFEPAELGLFGHSLGLTQEAPWIVAGEGTVIEPNMVLAVEAYLARPEVGGSNFEQNLIVRDDGPEIVTAACPSRWWD
jgi:Xaa-Pro aminopeptidase